LGDFRRTQNIGFLNAENVIEDPEYHLKMPA
jgi:hypothetical protein